MQRASHHPLPAIDSKWSLSPYQSMSTPFFSFFRLKIWVSPVMSFLYILFPVHQEILLALFPKHIQVWLLFIISAALWARSPSCLFWMTCTNHSWSPCFLLYLLFSRQPSECVQQHRGWHCSAPNPSIAPYAPQCQSPSPHVVCTAPHNLRPLVHTLIHPQLSLVSFMARLPISLTLLQPHLSVAWTCQAGSVLLGSVHRSVPLLNTFPPDNLPCQLFSSLSCLCSNVTFSMQVVCSTWTLNSLHPALFFFKPNTYRLLT